MLNDIGEMKIMTVFYDTYAVSGHRLLKMIFDYKTKNKWDFNFGIHSMYIHTYIKRNM